VARRRFQRGSVYLNRAGTVWLGSWTEYVVDPNGTVRRRRREITLTPIRNANGEVMGKKDARRLLQPYLDRANASLATPARELKKATFSEFAMIWERDYLSLLKPSTKPTMRGHVKKLMTFVGSKEIRQIGPADVQQLIAKMDAEGYDPKTIRNLWATLHLILEAALNQGYSDKSLPRPKLPRALKKKARHFLLAEVAKIIAASKGDHRVFYWLAAETGLRAGELAALSLTDITSADVTVNHSVWNGRIGTPKTQNAMRTIAVSPQLAAMLGEQIERQKTKGHNFLFSAATGSPWDMNTFRKREMQPLLAMLQVPNGGFHAFRHFNASLLLGPLRVPLKTVHERQGHALSGSLTLDVYTHAEMSENVEAAQKAGEEIEKAVNSVRLTAVQEKGPPTGESEALAA
jgi:integrase